MIALLVAVSLGFGCTGSRFTGPGEENRPPEVWLSSGPVEGDSTFYRVRFYWGGWDPDGEVAFYELVVADGAPFGFDPGDTTGLDAWTRTEAHDSVICVSADTDPRPYEGDPFLTRYQRTHTLFLRGVDCRGKRSEVVTRSFTARTLAPYVKITHPQGRNRSYCSVVTFKWEGFDPLYDNPSYTQAPDSIRYLCLKTSSSLILSDLNGDPGKFEDCWSPWRGYRMQGDSGVSTVIGDDEVMEYWNSYLFAVQAKDEAGAVTAVFREGDNARTFRVSLVAGPIITVRDKHLGIQNFMGLDMTPKTYKLLAGVELNFCWSADASSYGGEICTYRYGWDIQQLDDPSQWDVSPSPFHLSAPPRTWHSGIHTFFLEVVDNGGKISLARIEIDIVPLHMDRNLLLVDDWVLSEVPPSDLFLPDEHSHDEFWTELCMKAAGFDPERDIYDCAGNGGQPPGIEFIGMYRNIIYVYGNSATGAMQKIVRFTPESRISATSQCTVNYLSFYLAQGGHVWTSGRSDRSSGGLSVIFFEPPLFPASFKHDMVSENDQWDTSGVYCMAYKDYCVTVVDKVMGSFRSGAEMPGRTLNWDALSHCVLDDAEAAGPLSGALPPVLELSDEVTAPGMYFDPMVRGFIYVEAYDPSYWMQTKRIPSQPCFRPLYRMRTRNTKSPLDRAAVAVWIDRYADIVPSTEIGSGIAARSIHFGLPLWFFERSSVGSIAEVVFGEWGILATTEPAND